MMKQDRKLGLIHYGMDIGSRTRKLHLAKKDATTLL